MQTSRLNYIKVLLNKTENKSSKSSSFNLASYQVFLHKTLSSSRTTEEIGLHPVASQVSALTPFVTGKKFPITSILFWQHSHFSPLQHNVVSVSHLHNSKVLPTELVKSVQSFWVTSTVQSHGLAYLKTKKNRIKNQFFPQHLKSNNSRHVMKR